MRASGSSTPSMLADRQIELLADAGVGGACTRSIALAPAAPIDGSEMERPAARHSISMRQPCPAMLLAADDPVDRDEDVLAPVRAVGEGGAGRQMPPADLDAGMIGRDQRERDADVLAAAEMVVGIEQAEGEAEQRRLGRRA